jgi:Flp pilus assembly protein TadD
MNANDGAEQASGDSSPENQEFQEQYDGGIEESVEDPDEIDDEIEARVQPLIKQARYLYHTNNLALSEAQYLRVLKMHPRSSRAISGLVEVHIKRDDARSAMFWAQKLVRIRPNHSNSYVLLGDACKAKGQIKRAQFYWRKALKLNPRETRARSRLNQ